MVNPVSSNSIPEIQINNTFNDLFPRMQLGIFCARVFIRESDAGIESKIREVTLKISSSYSVEDISSIPAIRETKEAYRKLGKDPSRYRPSAEALCRRIVNGKSLFKINNVVDILNTISIEIGYSIGGYDLDKINGIIFLSKGLPDVSYDAIGRGLINIEDLPVLFDETGPFGCPTSDSTRTMVSMSTKNFLMIIFDFEGSGNMKDLLNLSADYYSSLAGVNDIKTRIFKVGS